MKLKSEYECTALDGDFCLGITAYAYRPACLYCWHKITVYFLRLSIPSFWSATNQITSIASKYNNQERNV